MKRPKVYLMVMVSLLLVALVCLLYVWFSVQFFHTKAKEASRDAYAPLEDDASTKLPLKEVKEGDVE